MADEKQLRLVTTRSATSEAIAIKLAELAARADEKEHIAMAIVLLQGDGTAFITTIGHGTRVALLGAVTDLQYSLCQDGDKKG